MNIAFALGNSRIDWGVHLGGFAAGLIACAVLDLIGKANVWLLRCKFPEAVKVNLTLLGCVVALWAWSGPGQAMATGGSGWIPALVAVVACCFVVKAIDLALSVRRGLAIVVAILAGVNGAVVMLSGWALALSCSPRWPTGPVLLDKVLATFCSSPVLISGLAAIGAAALTLWLCSKEISRGIEDVGFVGASLRAERNRRHGL